MGMKTIHVLASYKSSDKAHMEVIECSQLCEISGLWPLETLCKSLSMSDIGQ